MRPTGGTPTRGNNRFKMIQPNHRQALKNNFLHKHQRDGDKGLPFRDVSRHIKRTESVIALPPRPAFSQPQFYVPEERGKKPPHCPFISPPDSWSGMSDWSPVTAPAKIFYLCTMATIHITLLLTMTLFIWSMKRWLQAGEAGKKSK